MISPDAPQPRRRRPRRQEWDDDKVRNLQPRTQRHFYPDPERPGHGVRVLPHGGMSFYVVARDGFGKQRWIRIGSTDELTLAESREQATSIKKRIRAGLEPKEAPEPPPPKPDSVRMVV